MRIAAVALLLCVPWRVDAEPQGQQATTTPPLTLREAVTRALEHYPAVRVATESLAAAESGVAVARTSYLPRADMMWQANRATRNNVFGALLPQPVVPGISGPVGFADNSSVWGSATGLMVSWEPFDFGLRGANVQTALSTERRAGASVTLTRHQVATSAADAFLAVVAAQQTLRTAEASVERARVLRESVDARVNAGLRPGVDAARARAEQAVAETQRLMALQGLTAARVVLGHLIGVAPDAITVVPGPLLQLPPPDAASGAPATGAAAAAGQGTIASPVAAHPAVQEQQSAIEEAGSRRRALDAAWYPRFNLQGGTFARGSGARANGTRLNGLGGLGPDVSNWAFGLTVTFPLVDRIALRAREDAEFHRERAETARYDRVIEDLSGLLDRSQAYLASVRLIAQNTPVQLEAARAVEQQATARYQAGLGTILDVADAQRLLTQAETDDSIAKLNIWRGMFHVAAAQGTLDPFLARVQP